jgi:hypothetical protein
MGTTTTQIAGFLEKRGLKFVREDDKNRVLVPFNLEGNEKLLVVVALEENGEFLKLFSANLCKYSDGPYKLLLMQTLLMISWETKMLQWEYDPSDGEIRAMIEFPLEDAVLTERQFLRAFDALVQLVVTYFPRVKSVIATGKDPGRQGKDTPSDRLADEFRRWVSGGGSARGGGGGAPDAL